MIDVAESGPLSPLHVPADRELFAQVGPWQIRRYGTEDERFAYLASRAMLHVQLWHPERRISILTPSRLTGGRFEVARGLHRVSFETWPCVLAVLPSQGLPGSAELAALTMWLVVRCEVAASVERKSTDEHERDTHRCAGDSLGIAAHDDTTPSRS